MGLPEVAYRYTIRARIAGELHTSVGYADTFEHAERTAKNFQAEHPTYDVAIWDYEEKKWVATYDRPIA